MAFLSDFGGEAPVWVSGRTYAVGQVVRDPMDWYFRYVRVTGGAGTTNPINDPGSWRPDGGRPIKSIQRGVFSIPNGTSTVSVTISAVHVSRSELRYLGGSGMDESGAPVGSTMLSLTNSTTLTSSSTNGYVYNHAISWELTEYY